MVSHPGPGMTGTGGRRLLVLNGNTSQAVTDTIRADSTAGLWDGTDATFGTVPHGPAGIDNAAHVRASAAAVLDVLDGVAADYDAAIVACGVDPGVEEARLRHAIPVVGLAEAGLLAARMLGVRVTIPVLAHATVELMEDVVRRLGAGDVLAGVVAIDVGTLGAVARPDEALAAVTDRFLALQREGGLEAVLLTGSVMTGWREPLATALGVPVIAGLPASLALAQWAATATPRRD